MEEAAAESPRRVALVAGATGLVGRELVKSLVRSSAWTAVYAVARRRPPGEDECCSFCAYEFIGCNLLDAGETAESLRPLSGRVTHLFWTTWASQFPLGTAECCHQNRAMLSNVLDALLCHATQDFSGPTTLCHVSLQTGTNHYFSPEALASSADIQAVSLYDEESPRAVEVAHRNFYYVLEDLLKERLCRGQWAPGTGWSVHRPGLLLGCSDRSHYNIMSCLGVYGAICKRLRLPFTFFGHRKCWEEPYIDASDARLVAEQQLWWAASANQRRQSKSANDAGAGEAFNAVNETMFTWKEVWPALAAKFGLPAHNVFCDAGNAAGTSYMEVMGDKGRLWAEIVEDESLQPTSMVDLANWDFLDMLFRFPAKILVSHGKARGMGFETAIGGGSAEAYFLYWVDRMREEKLIPS